MDALCLKNFRKGEDPASKLGGSDFILGGEPSPTYYVTFHVVRADLDQSPSSFGYSDLFAQVDWETTCGKKRPPLYTETQWGCSHCAVWKHMCPAQVWKRPGKIKDDNMTKKDSLGDVVTIAVKRQTFGGLGFHYDCGSVTVPLDELCLEDGEISSKRAHELLISNSSEVIGRVTLEVSTRPAAAVVVLGKPMVPKQKSLASLFPRDEGDESDESDDSTEDTSQQELHIGPQQSIKATARVTVKTMSGRAAKTKKTGDVSDAESEDSQVTVFSVMPDGQPGAPESGEKRSKMLLPKTPDLGMGQELSFKPHGEAGSGRAESDRNADDEAVASYQQIAELAAKLRMGVSIHANNGGFFAQKQQVFITISGATDVCSVMKAFARVSAHSALVRPTSGQVAIEDEGPDLSLAWFESESSWANRQNPIREIDLTRVFDARLVHEESEAKVIVQYTAHDHHCGGVENNEEEHGADLCDDISIMPHGKLSRHFDRSEVEFFFSTVETARDWAERLNELCDIVSSMDES